MSTDGIQSVDQLRIEITADTQNFADGIKATREQLAQFVDTANPLIKTVDGAFGALGNTLAGLPAKITAAMGPLGMFLTTASYVLDKAQALSHALGMDQDFEKLKETAQNLGQTLGGLGAALVSGQSLAADAVHEKVVETLEQIIESTKTISISGFEPIKELTQLLRDLDGLAAGAFKAPDQMSSSELKYQIDSLKQSIRETTDVTGQMTVGINAFGIEFQQATSKSAEEIQKMTEKLEYLQKLMDERRWNAGTSTQVNPTFDMTKTLEGLEKQNQALEIQRATLGKSASEAARIAAEMRLAYESGDRPLTIGMDKDDKGKPIPKPYDKELEDQAKADFEEKIAQQAKLKQGIDDYKKAQQDAADEEKRRDQQEKGIDRVNETMTTDIEQIRAKTAELQFGTSVVAEEVWMQKELHAARKANVDLTDADIAGIRDAAQQYGVATQAMKDMQAQMNMIKEVSGAMSSALDSQFMAWTNGAAFNVKKMEQQILDSLANIALKTYVLGPLFGGSGTENGGMFGSLLSGFGFGGGQATSANSASSYNMPMPGGFGGFFASGGPVAGDSPIIVGENGPEMYVPKTAGTIVPNSALGGGATLHLNIDARGATPDAVAALRAQIPGMVLQTVQDAQQRGAL